MEFNIVAATPEDIPAIHEAAWKVFPQTYAQILSPAQTEYMMDWMYSPENLLRQFDDGQKYWLAMHEGKLAGYVSVEHQEEDVFHLQKIYVLPEYQGTGLGRLLFAHACSEIKKVHPAPCRVELNVNRFNKAIGFYERMGMHKDREGDFPIGGGFFMNDYIMVMEI